MIQLVCGLQYGDEGKGKVVAWLSREADIVVRAGAGPQAGHHVDKDKFVCQLPSGVLNPDARLMIGRGTVIDVDILLREIEEYDCADRVYVDPGCTIIEQQDIDQERELVSRIGSVGTGTGYARMRRIQRIAKTAYDEPRLSKFLRPVNLEIIDHDRGEQRIVIEGTQGYGLDLMDNRFYPYVTSQSTGAAQICADAGIGPRYIDQVWGCCKAYTTRVATGYIKGEWSEEKKTEYGISEKGTISGRRRRVGDFDPDLVSEAMRVNGVTHLVVNCVDVMTKKENVEMWVDDNILKNLPYDDNRVWIGMGPNPTDIYRHYPEKAILF